MGCGNGWLSNYLAGIPSASVIGADINRLELEQATRVFRMRQNLAFVLGDVLELELGLTFDQIIFASSIQYFRSITDVMSKVLAKLSPSGQMHIIDTRIYDSEGEAAKAKERSKAYFKSRNSSMAEFYHHHCWEDFGKVRFEVLYDPGTFATRLKRLITPTSPFPWIVINRAANAE